MITLERHSVLSKEISSADSRAAIVAAMEKLPAQFGFRFFTLMTAPAPSDHTLSSLIIETTLPRRLIQDFDARRLLVHCPLVPLLKNMALPLCWSYSNERQEDLRLAFPDTMTRILKIWGIATGVAMPLYSSNGSVFVMRLDGDRALLTLPELNELGMLFLQSFRSFDRLRGDEPLHRNLLTARELEVVRWTSQGKTSAEIANILSLSDHTVNTYLNKAIKKLDCVNRTQLVAKAIRLRLIS
ncbi:helix-turn-helix transcriptional regulator [Rhizobium sp. SL86]|jgi:DNA-binding CsgD family transcriptional regulator|uniref:helix-turn-helix transcriptional regulator n=1 Tax=Rhizobium sp. SL86 TaxID=2995148 RepID=UPI00227670A0|nr:LuxR C-terminal-related transcriptional regulator [Rhizobium sp. SL86]MCY1668143.1 LuxR C-terminal-related transcriptional regulator [Rhizobium sp. SL86]